MSQEEREEVYNSEDTEKKPKPISLTIDHHAAGNKYLTGINNWIRSSQVGYEPIYKNFDSYKQAQKLGDLTAYDKLKRAYNHFVMNKPVGRGNPPLLSTYARKITTRESTPLRASPRSSRSPVNQPPGFQQQPAPTYQPPTNVNNDFSTNKMSNDNSMDLETKSLFGKYYKDRSRGFKNKQFVDDWKNSMNRIYGITGKGFNISHNPDYLRNDYFDWVVNKKPP